MSPVKMGVDPEKLKAAKPAPGNAWYKLKFKGFKPKISKDKQSTNFNAQFEIVEHSPENNGKPVYMGLNTKFEKAFNEFSHGLGYPLNPDGTFVGDWTPDPNDPDNVEKMQYKGPLLGRVLEAELVVTSYQGNERNEIKQTRCKIDGCATKFPEIKHLTNMVKSN